MGFIFLNNNTNIQFNTTVYKNTYINKNKKSCERISNYYNV